MKLLDYLHPTRIDLHLKGTSKEQVMADLVAIMANTGLIGNTETLLSALLEREGLGSTGIGHGVAIPHGRSSEVSQPIVVIGRTTAEVSFDSIDGKPARIFFLLVAPENGDNEHLHLLAKIARLMRNAGLREQMLTLDSPDAVLELLKGHDLE